MELSFYFFGYILPYWLLVVVQAIKHTAYTNLIQKDIPELLIYL